MERILVTAAAESIDAAMDFLLSAWQAAKTSQSLSFALTLPTEPTEEELTPLRIFPAVQYIVAPDQNAFDTASEVWQGESMILCGNADMRFEKDWDKTLTKALMTEGKKTACALTWVPYTLGDVLECNHGVAAEGFDKRGRLLKKRGVALRYSAVFIRGALLNPLCCLAPASFYQDIKKAQPECDLPLSVLISDLGYSLFVPPETPLFQVSPLPLPSECRMPPGEEKPYFTERYAIDFAGEKLGEPARLGLFEKDLKYPLRIPASEKASESLRALSLKSRGIAPLLVTARPDGTELTQGELASFMHLSAIKAMELCCYAGSGSIRTLKARHPDTHLLRGQMIPALLASWAEDREKVLPYVQPFLLQRAMERYMSYTHYIWIDFDYAPYPIYEWVSPQWTELCTSHITMALVDGQVDPSMIIVPRGEMEPLIREAIRILRDGAWDGECMPDRAGFWRLLAEAQPHRFRFIDMTEEKMLFHLCTSLAEHVKTR